MKNKYLEKAIARIQPEERALMVKSLEIISRIHDILKRKKIMQKELAMKLGVSPAAISKMLSPGGNLELNTLIRLEIILGETIVTTPNEMAGLPAIQKMEHTDKEKLVAEYDYLIGLMNTRRNALGNAMH